MKTFQSEEDKDKENATRFLTFEDFKKTTV